jgi:hypothetical protein
MVDNVDRIFEAPVGFIAACIGPKNPRHDPR